MTAPAASVRARQTSDFTELAKKIQDMGLLRRRYGYYWMKFTFLVSMYVGAAFLFLTLGETWWQLALAAALGLLFTQAAFMGHDAAHRQIFNSGKRNEWAALLIANLMVGLSNGWWMNKHGKHHANPNKIDRDPDIEKGIVVFIPRDAAERTGFAAWFAARQGWMLFPLLTFEGLNLHVQAARTVFGRAAVSKRSVEILLLTVRFSVLFFAVFWVLPLGMAFAFLGLQFAVFGVYMGACFAPNHKGMPLVPKDLKIDFLRRQTLMSRNISGGYWLAVGMGGLNYQIEHHLFPSMPRPHLRLVQPIVRQYCADKKVAYTETTLINSYRIVIRYLNTVGLGQRDPFNCPITAEYRSR